MQRGFYTLGEGLFAGCCLLAVILFPGVSNSITTKSVVPMPIDVNSTIIQFTVPDASYGSATILLQDTVLFNTLTAYSDKAFSVSICFQIITTVAFLSRIDMFKRNMQQFKMAESRNLSRMMISSLGLVCNYI